jgi:hypothetical protein
MILDKSDPIILNKVLDETNDWNELSIESSSYLKEIYKWMIDDKKMDKLNDFIEGYNHKNSTIKIEFDDSIYLDNNISKG